MKKIKFSRIIGLLLVIQMLLVTIMPSSIVKVKANSNNQTTIYYRGYNNPNIHYKIGNGSWTAVPGVKMESNLDVDGYYYSITIDLGNEENLTACFNDGNGNWDSNNGNNYNFGVGKYTYCGGKITEIK